MDYQDKDPEVVNIYGKSFKKMIASTEILDRVDAMARQIEEKTPKGELPILIGILNGVFRIMADLVTAMHIPCEIQFVQIRSYFGMQSSGKVNMVKDTDYPLADRAVIIVEDIIDTGQTLQAFTKHVASQKPKSIQIVSLLKKKNFAADLSYQVLAGFEIEDRFVVGYGLDYDGLGRDLNSIYQLSDS